MAREKASPTSHSYRSQRLRLHYLDWGNPEAPTLLLVHGNRDHCHNWDWVAQDLRDDYHIVAPDFRGHGDSEWVNGSSYSHSEYIYDLAQLIHQQHLAPLYIIAHSLGGGVALRFAGVYPENVIRMIVIEGTGGPPSMYRFDLPSLTPWRTVRHLAMRPYLNGRHGCRLTLREVWYACLYASQGHWAYFVGPVALAKRLILAARFFQIALSISCWFREGVPGHFEVFPP